jgi:hypothetical protein
MVAPFLNGIKSAKVGVLSSTEKEATNMNITTIGIDLAKNVFQVHGVDERGKGGLKKQLKRAQVLPFCQPSAVPDRDGSLWKRTLLGQEAQGTWTYSQANGPAIRQALREDEQERCSGRRGDL